MEECGVQALRSSYNLANESLEGTDEKQMEQQSNAGPFCLQYACIATMIVEP